MKKYSKGLGLIELMVAMVLGLVVVLGVTQIFISAKNTYQSQNAAAVMQEDARYLFSRMIQDIRMVGMFGCIDPSNASFVDTTAGQAFSLAAVQPIQYSNNTSNGSVLTLLTGDVGNNGGTPTYMIVTDCKTLATVYTGTQAPTNQASANLGLLSMPVRQVIYTFRNSQIFTGPAASQQVLVNNVAGFSLTFGVAANAADAGIARYTAAPASAALIRSVRMSLVLTDPSKRVRNQTFNVVATLRNRIH